MEHIFHILLKSCLLVNPGEKKFSGRFIFLMNFMKILILAADLL